VVLKGLGVSSHVARGTAHVLRGAALAAPRRHVSDADIDAEIERLEAALTAAEADLHSLQVSLQKTIGRDAEIFGAQALLVRSSQLVEPVKALVREQRINVEAALLEAITRSIPTAVDSIEERQ
jgi:phosphoenolpyruvate-protein phosphotransferase (PTS system enzyme I)